MNHNEFQIRAPIAPQEVSPMRHEMHVLGIASAKRLFHAVGMDDTGKMVFRQRLSRHDLMPVIATLPPVRIGIEAWGGAHDWARRFREHGHEVQRMAPPCVKPYGKAHTNDRRDAEAIAAAVTRPTRRFGPTKDVDQPDSQALPRVRERLIGERTALVQEVPGLLHEDGMVRPQGVAQCRQAVGGKLEAAPDKRTPLSQEMLGTWGEELVALEAHLASEQAQREALATTPPAWQRLLTIPGLGPFTAPALVAVVSEASACTNGRQCAAWWGLVPCPHATGGQARWRGISQRGDRSLRQLLVPGARPTIRWVGRQTDRRSQGMRQLVERRGTNRTAGAGAHKHARMVWALLTSHPDDPLATGSGQLLRAAVAAVRLEYGHGTKEEMPNL
jgi:transposase